MSLNPGKGLASCEWGSLIKETTHRPPRYCQTGELNCVSGHCKIWQCWTLWTEKLFLYNAEYLVLTYVGLAFVKLFLNTFFFKNYEAYFFIAGSFFILRLSAAEFSKFSHTSVFKNNNKNWRVHHKRKIVVLLKLPVPSMYFTIFRTEADCFN